MRKDKIEISSCKLPGAFFYVIEDYLRVHLQPYLKSFHSNLDIHLHKKIVSTIQFLEVLTNLSDIVKKQQKIPEDLLLENKFKGLQIQKYEGGYKILIDRDTVPANPAFISKWNGLNGGVKIEASGEVMIKLYGIPNCDKIRKARKLLEQSGISHEFINLREDLPDEKILKRWLQELGENGLINKRSTTYRGLKDEDRNVSDLMGWVSLIKSNPTLIQRPLFELNEQVKIGLSELSTSIEELN